VVFGSEYDIAGTGFFEKIRPLIGVKKFRFELGFKLLVSKGRTKVFDMEVVEVLLLIMDAIPIPFCVTITTIGNNGCIRRNGEDTPVNEDAEFFLVEPGRDTSFVEGFPIGIKFLSLREKASK
jgi:hypothetical protein